MSFCWVKGFYLEEVFCLCYVPQDLDIPRVFSHKPWNFQGPRNLKQSKKSFSLIRDVLRFRSHGMKVTINAPVGWFFSNHPTSKSKRGPNLLIAHVVFVPKLQKNPSTLGNTSSNPMSGWKIDVSSGQLTLFKLYRADEVRYMIYVIYIGIVRNHEIRIPLQTSQDFMVHVRSGVLLPLNIWEKYPFRNEGHWGHCVECWSQERNTLWFFSRESLIIQHWDFYCWWKKSRTTWDV